MTDDIKILKQELAYYKEYAMELEDEINKLNRMKNGLMINNQQLTRERNELIGELQEIKRVSTMFEFANHYCNDDDLTEAGHAFARSLGVGQ